jgi:chromosome segregation ATPase
VFWKELAQKNSCILEKELSLRHELEFRNEALEQKWDGLRDELEKLRATREAAEMEAEQLAASLKEVSKKQREAEKTVNQLGSIWTESSRKFKSEMDRLKGELHETEMRAQKALKSVRGNTKSVTGENRRLKRELAAFASQLSMEQARNQEISKLKEINKLMLKRLEDGKNENLELKNENVELKGMVEMSNISSQVDIWQKETVEWKLRNAENELESERQQRASLSEMLVARDGELAATKGELLAASAAATDAEVKCFETKMALEVANERVDESAMQAARCQEAIEDVLRQKEGALCSVEKLMTERQELRKQLAKAMGERDFFEWLGLQQAAPTAVEWIEPGEPQFEVVDEAGWHENSLFGVANELYEST